MIPFKQSFRCFLASNNKKHVFYYSPFSTTRIFETNGTSLCRRKCCLTQYFLNVVSMDGGQV